MTTLPRSLIGRLAAAFVAVALVSASTMSVLVYLQLSRSVFELHEEALAAIADDIAAAVGPDGAGGLRVALPPALASRFDSAGGTLRFVLLDPAQRVLAASSEQAAPLSSTLPSSAGDVTFRREASGEKVWGLARRLHVGGRDAVLQLAENMTPADVVLDDVPTYAIRSIAWTLLAVVLASLVATVVAARAALRPLREASAVAETIGPDMPGRRLSEAGLPTETLPLIRAVNGALERLEEAYRRRREFSEDVAHELRTPLTILRAQVDLLPDARLGATLARELDGLVRLVNQLLDAAEAERMGVAAGARAELVRLCRDVATSLGAQAVREGKSIELGGAAGPIWAHGQEEAIARAVRNLVENALAHAPAGTSVEIRLAAPAEIAVIDHGPGVPPAMRERIFERFWRSDRRRGGRTGLGLAIVQRIVAAHGGRVSVGDGPGGGARFAITLPAAEAPP